MTGIERKQRKEEALERLLSYPGKSWTDDELNKYLQGINRYGVNQWTPTAKFMGGTQTAHQLRTIFETRPKRKEVNHIVYRAKATTKQGMNRQKEKQENLSSIAGKLTDQDQINCKEEARDKMLFFHGKSLSDNELEKYLEGIDKCGVNQWTPIAKFMGST